MSATADEHPVHDLDDVVHQRTRLAMLSLLRSGAAIEFTLLRDRLRLTDGNCNRHLAVLTDAGLIEVARRSGTGRARTWCTITSAGQAAFDREVAALRRLLDGDG